MIKYIVWLSLLILIRAALSLLIFTWRAVSAARYSTYRE